MDDLAIDLDEGCFLITKGPDRRIGPVLLRSAVRRVVDRRPKADEVSVEMSGGIILDEPEIEAIYVLASLAMLGTSNDVRQVSSKRSQLRVQP